MKEKIYIHQSPDSAETILEVLKGPASGPFTSTDFETSLGVPPRPPVYQGEWHEWLAERRRVLTAAGLSEAWELSAAYVAWLKAEHGFEEVEWEPI